MAKQLLYHLELGPHTSQQSRVCVPERVPSELLLNSNALRHRTNIFPQDRLAPDRSSTSVALAGENPVVCIRVADTFLPLQQSVCKNGLGTGFSDDSVLHGPTAPYTMERVTLILLWAKSMSPHFKPNISLCRKPVEAARRTNVRSRTSKLSTNALISLGRAQLAVYGA